MARRTLEDCLAVARDGSLCMKAKPGRHRGLVSLYHGNIFQDARRPLPKPNNSWHLGRRDEFENVLLCGSSAQARWAVSGIPA